MRNLQGAYSLTVATKDALLGIHDPLAVRPLCLESWTTAAGF